MSKKFVVMPSFPESQVNIFPGSEEFKLSSGTTVSYYLNVVTPSLSFSFPQVGPYDVELGPADLDEVIEFLQVVRANMLEVHGV